ncbi:MAG: hypothetical protein ACKVJC_07570, partial [Flavobacteriales bacterium]
MLKYYFGIIFLAINTFSYSQEESNSCLDPSKKVIRLLKSANEAKDTRTAVDDFNSAIALD